MNVINASNIGTFETPTLIAHDSLNSEQQLFKTQGIFSFTVTSKRSEQSELFLGWHLHNQKPRAFHFDETNGCPVVVWNFVIARTFWPTRQDNDFTPSQPMSKDSKNSTLFHCPHAVCIENTSKSIPSKGRYKYYTVKSIGMPILPEMNLDRTRE